MKWIKTAIGALIAISVVPLVVLSALNIKKSLETEKITITTELELYRDTGENDEYIRTIPFDELVDYYEMGFTITNLYDYANDINITITNWYFQYPDYLVISDNNSVEYHFYDSLGDSIMYIIGYESIYNVNDTDLNMMDITFAKSKTNLTATLLPFISVIFAGGVVLYIYKPFKKD